MQLELFEGEFMEPPVRMVLDTKDVQLGGKTPDEAIRAIEEAKNSLPEGSTDIYFEMRGGCTDIHQVCRLVFKRPPTDAEQAVYCRYTRPRLKVVAA